MSDAPTPSPTPLPVRLLGPALTLLALAASVWMVRPPAVSLRAPTPVGQAGAFPEAVRRVGDAWYWVERPPKGAARLVRARGGVVAPVAEAEAIGGYDVDGDRLYWSARRDGRWSIVSAGGDGAGAKALWSGAEPPHGLKRLDGALWWLRPVSTGIPFPSLRQALEIVALADGAAVPRVAGRLDEPGDGQVLGRRGADLVVATRRRESPGSTALWRVPSDGGAPVRLFSAPRLSEPLLTASGDLYALSPSEETATPLGAVVLWSIGPDGRARAVSDWLPEAGFLYESGRGILYADRESSPLFWRARGIDALPETLPLPPETFAVAAGGDRLLLARSTMGSRTTPILLEVPRP